MEGFINWKRTPKAVGRGMYNEKENCGKRKEKHLVSQMTRRLK